MSDRTLEEAILSVEPSDHAPARIAREFRARLANGARLQVTGDAKDDPEGLVKKYPPAFRVDLFGASFWLTGFKKADGLNFLVGYVELPGAGRHVLHPRIFYKDSTLVWRVASHRIHEEDDEWIGKGDLAWERDSDGWGLVSDEDTTNLPFELQAAFDRVSRARKPRRDEEAIALVLRRAPTGRIRPFADFSRPRERAAAAARLNAGRPIARFRRYGDPDSLVIAAGFEPDFGRAPLERTTSRSRMYGGPIERFRILSVNGRVQYRFLTSPKHVWVNPPQALTTELTTYGVRALHVPVEADAFLPAYEFHFLDESTSPPELVSQIPAGYAGAPNPVDPDRADASAWLERLSHVRDFRRRVLAPARRARARRKA